CLPVIMENGWHFLAQRRKNKHMTDNSEPAVNRFLRSTDLANVPGPDRELRGYGEKPPVIRWANGAKVAVNIVINLEEGSELTYAMGDGCNEEMHELPFHQYVSRDLGKESFFEYGSRTGIWRLLRILDNSNTPATIFASAVALERNKELAEKIKSSQHDVVGHGYRWSNHFDMTYVEEQAAIRKAIESLERTTGARPIGWYCREMSVNTRSLVQQEGLFYDSDCYSDDLPYWTVVNGEQHLVVPYSLTTNDCRYVLGTGYSKPADFVSSV